MIEEKKMQNTTQPDFNDFYNAIHGYTEYCIRSPKEKLTQKEKENLSKEEITEKEEELKVKLKKFPKQKKYFQQYFESMCSAIAEGGLSYLSTYVEAAQKLYEEESDWKHDIKTMLVTGKSLQLFRNARNNLIGLYPILIKVNATFPVDDYSELSLAPRAAIYGSEVNRNQKGSTKKAPLKNEDVQAMLDIFLQVNDAKHFGEWIMEILQFKSSHLIDVFQEDFIPERKKLKEWVVNQIGVNEKYRCAVMEGFLNGNNFKNILDALDAQPILKLKQAELERKIKTLEETNAKEKADYRNLISEKEAKIQERDVSIDKLQQMVKDFERCKQQLTDCTGRYQNQIAMNERIVAENERRLGEMETDYNHMQDELAEAQSRLESVKAEYSALQSDFSLKSNELMRLKDISAQKEKTARIDIMRELVSGIKEQFYYLTMFYLELKDTGKLEPESIGLYADTLENIDHVLLELGIKKFGIIDQKVTYDASIYNSSDTKIANGEQVIVRGYGWKIGDDVYIKAPVEKGE